MSRSDPGRRAGCRTAVLMAALVLLAPPAGCSRTAVRQAAPHDVGVVASAPAAVSGAGRPEPPGPVAPEPPPGAGRDAVSSAPAAPETATGGPALPPVTPAPGFRPEPPADAPPAVKAEEPPTPDPGRAGDGGGGGSPDQGAPQGQEVAAKAGSRNGMPAKAREDEAAGKRAETPPEGAAAPPAGGSFRAVVARLPEGQSFAPDGPPWTREKEELVYRVETLGITMGYARFAFLGKVLLDGREAYHLNVRAWTSDILSLIYPVDETIDYYMDVKTLAPLRQETTKRDRSKDDVTLYDQQKGTIVSRYKRTGEIRKKVDAVPNVYDPVTVAYLFRAGDLSGLEKPRNLFTGRKLWEISARTLGSEKIRTGKGEVDTVLVKPVIKRNGQVVERGDLKMWMTLDGRHVPVRLYAKFKKIRTWTLVGELLPDRKGG